MIAFLRGKLLEKHPNQIIVDTAGVGYDVVIPISTFSALPDAGAEVALHIHTHVREDALALFGFFTSEEKRLFEKLISIKVLSGLATPTIIDAIRGGDVDQLVRIPGVGKKTAERMVLELKDKLEGLGGGALPAVASRAEPALSAIEHDVLSALLNLGCQRAAAEAAVRKAKAAEPGSAFEPLFRKSLELVR